MEEVTGGERVVERGTVRVALGELVGEVVVGIGIPGSLVVGNGVVRSIIVTRKIEAEEYDAAA